MLNIKICLNCKLEYKTYGINSKFCSKPCKNTYRVNKACIVCDEIFESNSSTHKYCSKKCSKAQWKSEKSDYISPTPGKPRLDSDGYYKIYLGQGHDMANGDGYAYVHRLAMAEHIGRPLLPGETVHHKDGNRQNNDLSNLELWSTNHGAGVRVEDLVPQVVQRYTDLVRKELDKLDGQ